MFLRETFCQQFWRFLAYMHFVGQINSVFSCKCGDQTKVIVWRSGKHYADQALGKFGGKISKSTFEWESTEIDT